MRKIGLADGVGLVAALVAVAWLPGWTDPLTYPKLLALAGGGLALAPAVIRRLVAQRHTLGALVVPCAAAALLLLWAAISAVGSGAPLWNSVFGWWGRGDGLLALLGAVVLLLGAASLDRDEIGRAVVWLLGGASLVALVGLLQVAGVDFPPGAGGAVTGLMGNTNFAAGYFAMMASLALGRALLPGSVAMRAWGAILFIVVAILAVLTEAVQGPAAMAAGLVAFGVAYALLYRGKWRVWGLAAAAVVVAVGSVGLVASFFQVGPLASLWTERTFAIRQQYWQSAVNIMTNLPVFGTGPDGFSRYVAEYRPESYVELLGPVLRVSAAHNVALQFGATLGVLGLLLWLMVFVGTGLLLLVRIVRGPVASIALTASIAGGFAAYLVQGMVSIDMLPILATGWAIGGLAIAAAREPLPKPEPQEPAPTTRKAKARSVSPSISAPPTPLWVPISGGVLALAGIIVVGAGATTANSFATVSTAEAATELATNPMLPCALRTQLTQAIVQNLGYEASRDVITQATALDPRCPPMITTEAEAALNVGDLDVAGSATASAVSWDPLFDVAWMLRTQYLLRAGDVAGAEAAVEEAARVQSLYPTPDNAAALAELRAAVEEAKQGA